MALTNAQIQAIQNHLVAAGADITCRVCRHPESIIVGLYRLPMQRPDNSGAAIPSIALMCERCSHIEWFAAVPILGRHL